MDNVTYEIVLIGDRLYESRHESSVNLIQASSVL